jgi:hypothetical protein
VAVTGGDLDAPGKAARKGNLESGIAGAGAVLVAFQTIGIQEIGNFRLYL